MSWSVNKREFLAGSAIGAAWAFGGRMLGSGSDAVSFDRRIAAALIDERSPLGERLADAARRAAPERACRDIPRTIRPRERKTGSADDDGGR